MGGKPGIYQMPNQKKGATVKKGAYSPLQIFVCSHKPFTPPALVNSRPDIYKIITNCDDPFPVTKLDVMRLSKMECEYGSEQNKCLNEWRMINAIYHMKYIPEYIGICHYRRYYDPRVIERLEMRFLDKECEMHGLLGDPFSYQMFQGEPKATEKYYAYWHNGEDFQILREVFQEMHPELMTEFEEMADQDKLYVSAMMILNREDFYDMCEFNFDMYDALMERYGFKNDEDALKHIKDNHDKYIKPNLKYYTEEMQSRLISYLIERCTNVWLRTKREDGTRRMDTMGRLEWKFDESIE